MTAQASASDWAIFWVVIALCIGIDLWSGRGRDAPEGRRALAWTAGWIAVALVFGAWVWFEQGKENGLLFYSAYALEKSLSVDNLFVFVLVFGELAIPRRQQRRVLFWGIIGALVARGALIWAGVALLGRFQWLFYPFALLLLLSAARMMWGGEREKALIRESCAVCTTWVARFIPLTGELHGERFWTRIDGRMVATPLMIALIVVETTDLLFAVESIPAVLALTTDPFLVYTSNVFAILGMRSLYFVLAGAIEQLRYLRAGLAAVLLFLAAKMLGHELVEVSATMSLGVIAAIIGLSAIASVDWARNDARHSRASR